jgi:hypothetical protein
VALRRGDVYWLTPQASVEWKRRTKHVCKPCWELKYCPYGPLVEDFPTSPVSRAEMTEHMQRLSDVLTTRISAARRKSIEQMLSGARATPS